MSHIPSMAALSMQTQGETTADEFPKAAIQDRIGTTDIGAYESSPNCPRPSEAGNLNNAVAVHRGSSGQFVKLTTGVRPVTRGQFLREDKGNFVYLQEVKLKATEMAKQRSEDWARGTVTLDEHTEFMHVSNLELPSDLERGVPLRSTQRVFAHTDVAKWTWNRKDRVKITWPTGTPFQIVNALYSEKGELIESSDGIYTRSCRYLEDSQAYTVEKGKSGLYEWPYANTSVLLPPAYFEVVKTPELVDSPEKYARDNLYKLLPRNELEAVDKRTKFSDIVTQSTTDGTVTTFLGTKKELGDLQYLFKEESLGDDEYERYSATLKSGIKSSSRKRRVLGVVPVEDTTETVTWSLNVTRTSKYKLLEVKAKYIDMTNWIQLGIWNPLIYTFQNVPNAIFAEELELEIYCRTVGGHINLKTDAILKQDTMIDGDGSNGDIKATLSKRIHDPSTTWPFEQPLYSAIYTLIYQSETKGTLEFTPDLYGLNPTDNEALEFVKQVVNSHEFEWDKVKPPRRVLQLDGIGTSHLTSNVFDLAMKYGYFDLLEICMNTNPKPKVSLYKDAAVTAREKAQTAEFLDATGLRAGFIVDKVDHDCEPRDWYGDEEDSDGNMTDT